MLPILTPEERIYQPHGATRLRPELRPGVVFNPAAIPPEITHSYQTAPGFFVDQYGIGYQPITTGVSGYYASLPQDINPGELTLIVVAKGLHYNNHNGALHCYESGKGYYLDFRVAAYSGTGLAILVPYITYMGIATYALPSTGLKLNDGVILVITIKTGVAKCWANGSYVGSVATGTYNPSNSNPMMIGNSPSGSFRGGYFLAAQLPIVDDSYAQQLSNNPWQIFERNRLIPFLSSAGLSDLSANAQSSASSAGSITSGIVINGAALAAATASGIVNQSMDLSGSSAAISVANGIATITATLSGDAFNQAFADGTLAMLQTLTGDSTAVASAWGGVNIAMTLDGGAVAHALAQADLDSGAQNDLSGAAQVTAGASASATMALAMLADAGIQTSASGAILCALPVSGTAPATVTGSGGVTSTQSISGSAVTVANASGDVTIGYGGLSASAIIEALAGGSITMQLSVSATALANAVAAAGLTVTGADHIPLSGAYQLQNVSPAYRLMNVSPRYSMRAV